MGDVISPTTPVTLEFWSKGAGAGNWLGRVGHFGVYRGNRDYGRIQTVTLQFSSGVYASADLGTNGINIDLDSWHHYVVTHDGGNVGKLYIDGALYLTGVAPRDGLAGELVVGESGGRAFDEIALYNKVVTPAVMQRHVALATTSKQCDNSGGSAPYAQRLIADGAVGLWRAGDAGLVAFDTIGCRNATFSDGATKQVPGLIVNDPNQAFTSLSGGIRSDLTGVITPAGPVSLEFWSKGTNSENWLGRIGHFGVYRGNRDYGRIQTLTLQFAPGVYASTDLGANGVNINLDSWHHYVVTHDGVNAGKLYIDGVLYLSGTAGWDPLGLELAVGESSGRSFDEIAVYNKVVPTAHIKDHFTRGLNGSPCSLAGSSSGYGKVLATDGAIGVWRLGSGPVAFDSVGCRNGSYGDGATFVEGAVVGDTDLALRSGGEMRTYIGDTVPSGSPVSVEFWSKGASADNWIGRIGRIGHFGVYRGNRDYGRIQTVTLQFSSGVYASADLGTNGINIDLDAWHHYVITHDGVNAGKLYIDGALYLTGTAPWNGQAGELAVGESRGRATDELALYNKVLGPDVIRSHFSSTFASEPCSVAGSMSGYAQQTRADGAIGLWRAGDEGRVAYDTIGCRNGSYGDGAQFPAGVIAGDTDKSFKPTVGALRGDLTGAVTRGGAVSLEFWSKGVDQQGWLARVGHFGVYRGNRDYGRIQTVTLQFSSGVYASADRGANGINIDLDEWHHFVVTHDGVNAGKLYIDGVLYLTGTAPWDALSNELAVGESLNRTYDEIALYNRR